MSDFDLAKLAKLLELTASNHDGEALAAARKANEMVRGAGTTWTDLVLNGLALTEEQCSEPEGEPSIEEMLSAIWSDVDLSERQRDFFAGIERHYRIYERLSEKQMACLVSGYERSLRRRRAA